MPVGKPFTGLRTVLAMFVMATFMTGTRAAAQTEKVLFSFGMYNNNGAVGSDPYAGVIFDASGNLYGATFSGGSFTYCFSGCGTVFELTPAAGGGWTETVLHSFQVTDGTNPGFNGGLVFDADGNLYGMAQSGGAYGYGNVFELTPGADGGWALIALHDFAYGGTDGAYPSGSLIFDTAGNLYGTTAWGGTGPCTSEDNTVGCGTVFELSPKAGGGWEEKVLHNFGHGADGTFPDAGLVFDGNGNLYGVTHEGGTGSCSLTGNLGCGTVFELTPEGDGRWDEKVLHHFNLTDGGWPVGSLIFDAAGNIYGMTDGGGSGNCQAYTPTGCGTVFELTPADGGWAEKVLHNFNNNGKDGIFPYSGLILDASGNLYGTTTIGGNAAFCGYIGCGTVFELMPKAGGGWAERIVHSFRDTPRDGDSPADSLIFDGAGNLYGTTLDGGAVGGGTVFEIKP
jgi:uncharacterized repeat protein (TIGR03803 family)